MLRRRAIEARAPFPSAPAAALCTTELPCHARRPLALPTADGRACSATQLAESKNDLSAFLHLQSFPEPQPEKKKELVEDVEKKMRLKLQEHESKKAHEKTHQAESPLRNVTACASPVWVAVWVADHLGLSATALTSYPAQPAHTPLVLRGTAYLSRADALRVTLCSADLSRVSLRQSNRSGTTSQVVRAATPAPPAPPATRLNQHFKISRMEKLGCTSQSVRQVRCRSFCHSSPAHRAGI